VVSGVAVVVGRRGNDGKRRGRSEREDGHVSSTNFGPVGEGGEVECRGRGRVVASVGKVFLEGGRKLGKRRSDGGLSSGGVVSGEGGRGS
jgi:hypothetical protein